MVSGGGRSGWDGRGVVGDCAKIDIQGRERGDMAQGGLTGGGGGGVEGGGGGVGGGGGGGGLPEVGKM